MLVWLLKVLGISGDFVTYIDDVRLAVQNPLALWIGLPLLVPAITFVFLRQRCNLPSAPPVLRLALTATRAIVLLLLVLVLAGPFLKLDHRSEKKPIVAFLFDQSQSMQLPAGPYEGGGETLRVAQAAGYRTGEGSLDSAAVRALNQISRAKLAQDAVKAAAPALLAPLAEKFDVQFYAFSREPKRLGIDPLKFDPPEPPNPGGPATHLGDVLAHVLDEAGGQPIAGILLFSDGQNTGGSSPAEAAQRCSAKPALLFAVPVGSTTRLRDVAIVDTSTSGQVAVGDTVRVAVTVESQGFDKRPVKVELRDGDKLLDTKDLILRSTEQQQVELTFQAKDSGARYLTVRVPPLPGEPEYLRGNNEDVAFVRVSEEKLKVLYIEGGPRWDFRFLKNSMRRDNGLAGRVAKSPDLVLETEWRRLPKEQQAQALPRTLEELAQYHTVILGDVSPRLLTPAFVSLLAEAVREKGVGVMVEPGPLYLPHRYGEELQKLLPVVLQPGKAGLLPTSKAFKMELAADGSVHEAMRLYDDPGRNQAAWAQMQSYGWCVAAERPAPGAAVLAWNPSYQNDYGRLPLIAHHNVGAGKVMLVGTDSTWLWRRNVGDRFFYKFWGQAIRFVARREQAGKKKSWLELGPVRAQPGELAQVELMAYDANGVPRSDKTLPVRVTGLGKSAAVELTADPSSRGRYTGKFLLEGVGDYRVTYAAPDSEPVEARLKATIAPEELRQPNVNRTAMELLAKAAKGKLVELPDLASVVPLLLRKVQAQQIQLKREASLWDNWLVLAVLVFVYSLDVGLRRLAGLS